MNIISMNSSHIYFQPSRMETLKEHFTTVRIKEGISNEDIREGKKELMI